MRERAKQRDVQLWRAQHSVQAGDVERVAVDDHALDDRRARRCRAKPRCWIDNCRAGVAGALDLGEPTRRV